MFSQSVQGRTVLQSPKIFQNTRSCLGLWKNTHNRIHLSFQPPTKFRDKLNPASGFQSMQFRELEFLSGAKDEKILASFKSDEYAFERLSRRFVERSLADAFWQLASRSNLKTETHDDRVAATVEILTHPEKYAELYNMQDLLIEHDELIISWRYNHILMVERMLGMKRGTGGSEGVGYLQTTLTKKFFPELWEARTHLKVSA